MTTAYYLSVVCRMCQQAWTQSFAIIVHVIKKKKNRQFKRCWDLFLASSAKVSL